MKLARVMIAVLVAALGMMLQAAEVTGDMALAAAEAWSVENQSLSGEMGSPVSVKERRGDDGTLLWYEVAMSGGGCVVASADTEIEPIVAVVDRYDGEIPEGHPLKAMLFADMSRRLGVLRGGSAAREFLSAGKTTSSSAVRDVEVQKSAETASRKWTKLTGGAQDNDKGIKGRFSLLGSTDSTTPKTVVRYLPEWALKKLTFWNQFNTYTPNGYPAGCVATAGAALLQFFNITAAPKLTNDCWVDGVKTSLKTKGINYDWSILPEENASYDSFTDEQKDVADRAVYDMGVCLSMSYRSGGSGSTLSTLAYVLRTRYAFADARYANISANYYEKLIYAQNRAGAPVVLGVDGPRGGHAVLAVGYGEDADATAYTRIFMGWGGSSDAWYAFPNVGEFTVVDSVVTMIGATSDTLAVRGRVTAESGAGAAYVDVKVGSSKTVETDENGYWGVRVTPVAGTLSCSCGGTVKSVTVGSAAANVNVENYYYGEASSLASALPGIVDFTVSDADALVVYSSPSEAVRAALREGKILMVLLGYDSCSGCGELKDHIKGMGSSFTSDFVLFYANTQANGDFGLSDETCTGVPYWGTFDPRVWKLENRWAADNGRFTICTGYSSSSTTRDLNSARSQWAGVNAAPTAIAVAAPDQITMPTVLTLKLSFPDGTKTAVREGLTWSIVSGTAATITGGDMLTPVEGASGDVTVKCEGYFWNSLYTATKTIRIIDGVVATGLVIDGPEVVDLLKVDGAQFSAKAVLADGSQVEVPVSWDVTEAKVTNCTMSASGYVSFKKSAYAESSTVRVSARYGDYSAFSDLTIWGASAKVYKYTLSDTCAWPGKTVTLTIDKVQWWRHGGWEEPTEDFTGVGVYWYYFVGNVNCYQTHSIGTSRTISFTVPADKNDGSERIEINLRTSGHSLDDCGVRWMTAYLQYAPAEPSQVVTVTFDGNGGEPAEQTATYAVGRKYSVFPEVYKKGYYCNVWYTAAVGGTRKTTSSNCLASVTRLYARWTPRYCYTTYNANGGTGSMSASWFDYDTPENLRKNTFTKTGSMFAGWATSPDGPVVYQDEAKMLHLSDANETLSLYAVWVENGYKVVFDANGGTGEMAPQMCQVGACSHLKPATFTRRGATFVGWSRTPGGKAEFDDGDEVCNLATACGETVTLYAVWNLPLIATIELAGPDVIDLYDVESAQFTATCRYANGSAADVDPKWTITETAVTNAVISPDGIVTFPDPTKYTKASMLKVTAECNGVSASKEVNVWGWSVSLSSWTSPQRVVWPGQILKIVPQTVTWWRHGVTEEPTGDFSDVTFISGYGWINDKYFSDDGAVVKASGIELTIPSGVSDTEGCAEVCIITTSTRYGRTCNKYNYKYFKYLPSAPAQTVDVTFVADGGIPETQTSRYAVGRTYDYLPESARMGYNCSWYTAAEGGTQITGGSDCLASVTRLYAHWSPIYYYIKYDANGGEGSMSASRFNYDTPANLRANAFTKAGAMFAGWATSPDGPVVYQDGEEILNLSSVYVQITLYAVWSTDCYSVEFDANGGTGGMNGLTAAVGSCIMIPGCSFVRSGYAFAGWAVTRDGEVKFTAGARVCDLAVSSGDTVTLYAVWQANTYAVTLNRQSGIGGTSSVTATYGSAMPDIDLPTRSGYAFGGYYTSVNGNGIQYYTSSGASARTWDRMSSTTLYAKWTALPPTYNVVYDPGANGEGAQQTATKTKGVTLTLMGAVFTRIGYTQTGWSTRDGGAKSYNLGASYAVNAALTLYPFWTANSYAVTLDVQGGSGGTACVTATYGSAMPSIAIPSRPGYAFGGFCTGANGSGIQYYTASGASARAWDVAGETTLYAKWTQVYDVIYKPGAKGSGSQQAATKTKGEALALKGALFTRTGYTQTGWAKSDGGARAYDLGASYTADAAITLYPFWTANGYSIYYNANGGSGTMSATSATYDGETTISANGFTRAGCIFLGWATEPNGEVVYAAGDAVTNLTAKSGGVVTLYAVWMRVYNVVLHKNDGGPDDTTNFVFESGVATRIASLAKLGWAKRGFDFLGWGKYPNSTVVWKQNWASVTDLAAAGDTADLYGMWAIASDSYAIEYWRNDGAGTWRWVGFKHGVKTRMPSLANGLKWARRGYEFKGWELTTADANDNTRAAPWKGDWAYVSSPVAKGGKLTAYARWALKPGYYQIRFNRNDGGGKWRTLGFERGKGTKLSTIGALGWERDGYEFVGWASSKANADAGKLWKPDGAWVTNAAAEGKTLSIYAIWREK